MLNPRLRRGSPAVWGGSPFGGTYYVPRRRTVARSALFGCLVGHTARQPDMPRRASRIFEALRPSPMSLPKAHSLQREGNNHRRRGYEHPLHVFGYAFWAFGFMPLNSSFCKNYGICAMFAQKLRNIFLFPCRSQVKSIPLP